MSLIAKRHLLLVFGVAYTLVIGYLISQSDLVELSLQSTQLYIIAALMPSISSLSLWLIFNQKLPTVDEPEVRKGIYVTFFVSMVLMVGGATSFYESQSSRIQSLSAHYDIACVYVGFAGVCACMIWIGFKFLELFFGKPHSKDSCQN